MTEIEVGICLLAIIVGILVKAITGMGFPLVAIPVISIFVSVEDAVAVIALPNVLMNSLLCWDVRDSAKETRDLPALSVTAIVGAVLGTWMLVRVPENILMIALALMIFGYIGHNLHRPDALLAPDRSKRWSPAIGFVAGVMQGALGISGPLVAGWIHAYRLTPNAFVFSVTLLFLLSGVSQLGVLLQADMIVGTRLWVALAAIPLVLLGTAVGTRLREKLSNERFSRAVLVVLFVSAASLVLRAWFTRG